MPVLEYAPPPSTRVSNGAAVDKDAGALQSTRRSPFVSLTTPARDAETMMMGSSEAVNDLDGRRDAEGRADEVDISMHLATSQSTRRQSGHHHHEGQSIVEQERNGVSDLEDDDSDDDDDDDEDGPPLHIEVRLKSTSTLRYDILRRMLHSHLNDEYETLLTHSEVHDWREVAVLEQNVERVWIGECALPTQAVPLTAVTLQLYLYQPPSSSNVTEFSTNPQNDEDGDSDVPAATVLELPSRSLEGVWDTLIYEGYVKEKLLGYIHSTMLFSDASVDFNVVTWNRVVLLHGPPGTGKTSLCRSLAQKLAIRLSDRYDHGKLIEINSHSLFSKWFSESGKLVQRLFAQVTDMVDDENCFVVVLIDEVESLTAARAGAMSGKEPSDALRVVNALLTQLDKLKHRKNCLVMTTSNLSSAIDNAFIDRADIKQYIGLPPIAAVYWILQSCLNEIMRAGLIPPVHLADYKTIQNERERASKVAAAVAATPDVLLRLDDEEEEEDGRIKRDTTAVPEDEDAGYDDSQSSRGDDDELDEDWACSLQLAKLSEQCQGMSGRTLRRLPVLAHARHLSLYSATATAVAVRRSGGDATTSGAGGGGRPSRRRKRDPQARATTTTTTTKTTKKTMSMPKLERWLEAMSKCVEEEGVELDKVLGGGGGGEE